MFEYKITTVVRYVSLVEGNLPKWVISLEGVGSLGMSEKPEFKAGDRIYLILEGPLNAQPQQSPIK